MPDAALWKLAPAAVTKPWGLVHSEALEQTGIRAGIGELWLASAQTGKGNYSNTVIEPPLRKDLASLLDDVKARGDAALESLLGRTPLEHVREHPYRGKTEAWHIRAAIGRVGVVAGPRTRQEAERLKEIILDQGLVPHPEQWSDEVHDLFGTIEPLAGGETFLTPAGALHTMFAIGPESVLIIDEIQQGYGQALLPTLSKILLVQNDLLSVQVHPSDSDVAGAAAGRLEIKQDLQANPTVRVYDFGRRPGEYPELGFQLVRPEAGLRRVASVTVAHGEGCRFEILVADPHFAKARLTLQAGSHCDLGPVYGSYHVLHCLRGRALLRNGNETMPLDRGETVMVPGGLERRVTVEAQTDCMLFDDSLPLINALEDFLTGRGASAEDVKMLMDPPPAR